MAIDLIAAIIAKKKKKGERNWAKVELLSIKNPSSINYTVVLSLHDSVIDIVWNIKKMQPIVLGTSFGLYVCGTCSILYLQITWRIRFFNLLT